MSETMKKRYEDVSATLCAIHGLKYSHCLTREEAEAIESLLDDLMAERGKMKERVELDELFGVDVRRRADYYRAFNEKGNQLEGDKSLQRVCAYLLRAYDPQPFILKAHTFEDGGDVEIAEMRVRINPITVEIVEDK